MEILKFEPLLKQTLWGGERIKVFKHLDTAMSSIGESWELSGVEGNETVVADGSQKGKSLNELVREMKGRLVGEENYRRFGDQFPLLVKFIDAQKDLSIQVHPNEEIAHRHGKPHGKTEMWYAVDPGTAACPPPTLYCGLNRDLTPETYKQMVADGTITDALERYEVHDGDVFFIPAGRIHSIGAGGFVAEIQQTSDVTYRIYDFNRRDKDGNLRQLHTKEAAECIDYTVLSDYRTHYTAEKNCPEQVVSCPYFSTAIYDLDEPMTIDYSDLDSFVILIAVKGEATITVSGGDTDQETVSLHAGETVLIPACTDKVTVNGTIKFLETFV